MKFKITSKKSDGTLLVHTYDNITQDIFTDENIPIFLDQDPRLKDFIKNNIEDKNSLYKSTDNVNLRITLGFNCNFNCKYCLENYTAKSIVKPIFIVKEISLKEKVDNLINKLKNNLTKVNSITFWGGEPLVYLKTMKLLVPKLKELYPNVKLGTISNGSLITKEVAQYLLDNDIGLTVSHDGPTFSNYRDDLNPLENPKVLEGLKYYKEQAKEKGLFFGFNIVVTPDNSDLSKLHSYFAHYFGEDVDINFEGIVKLSDFSKNVVKKFDSNTKKILLNNLIAFGSTVDGNHPYHSIRDYVSRLISKLVNKELKENSCFIRNKNAIAVDMQGNLLICHGSDQSYGTLDTIKTSKFPDEYLHFWKDRKKCKECPMLVSCLGDCIMASEEDNELSCENHLIWHSGLFLAAWKLLFDSIIIRIESIKED